MRERERGEGEREGERGCERGCFVDADTQSLPAWAENKHNVISIQQADGNS